MTRCLIDADVLSYECSFAGQFKDELSGEVVMKDFDSVSDFLHMKIREITEECMSDEEPLLFLSPDSSIASLINRSRLWLRQKPVELLRSFRYGVARTKPYKGQRRAEKPLHFNNIRAYMLSEFDVVVKSGLEADDMLAVYETANPEDVLCSVDKDLRQVPGLHYTWSVGNRPSLPVYTVDKLGTISLTNNNKKLFATGMRSFFAQVLMGDTVDNIQGVPKFGPVAAYKTLKDLDTEEDMFTSVANVYRSAFEDWEDKLREHIDLVYMIRELNEDGSPVLYKYPEGWRSRLDQKAN